MTTVIARTIGSEEDETTFHLPGGPGSTRTGHERADRQPRAPHPHPQGGDPPPARGQGPRRGEGAARRPRARVRRERDRGHGAGADGRGHAGGGSAGHVRPALAGRARHPRREGQRSRRPPATRVDTFRRENEALRAQAASLRSALARSRRRARTTRRRSSPRIASVPRRSPASWTSRSTTSARSTCSSPSSSGTASPGPRRSCGARTTRRGRCSGSSANALGGDGRHGRGVAARGADGGRARARGRRGDDLQGGAHPAADGAPDAHRDGVGRDLHRVAAVRLVPGRAARGLPSAGRGERRAGSRERRGRALGRRLRRPSPPARAPSRSPSRAHAPLERGRAGGGAGGSCSRPASSPSSSSRPSSRRCRWTSRSSTPTTACASSARARTASSSAPKAIIGRKVQHCHPPGSVDIVERIVADFRTGRQDVAEFWIEFQGRFVHIRYFAVRDEEGAYLGTLEVTQDLTRERALTGRAAAAAVRVVAVTSGRSAAPSPPPRRWPSCSSPGRSSSRCWSRRLPPSAV